MPNVWADEITSTEGNDNLLGTNNPDTISGLAGDDKIDSKEGKDQVNGNRGNVELHGGKSRDIIKGGPGLDKLFGEGVTINCMVELGMTISREVLEQTPSIMARVTMRFWISTHHKEIPKQRTVKTFSQDLP
jgi:hypothetical protein